LLLLALLAEKVVVTLISLLCFVILNSLIFVSLRNSQVEAARILATLQNIYKDNDLDQYFGAEQAAYYRKRYRLWLTLQPSLMVFAIVVAFAIKYAI
jgi:hypothetical protein